MAFLPPTILLESPAFIQIFVFMKLALPMIEGRFEPSPLSILVEYALSALPLLLGATLTKDDSPSCFINPIWLFWLPQRLLCILR